SLARRCKSSRPRAMPPRMLQRTTTSKRNSLKSKTTRTTRSLLKAGGYHDPHSEEHASRVSKSGGHFLFKPQAAFATRIVRKQDEYRADLTDVHQALLLRNPWSGPQRGRIQTQGGVPQACDEMAPGQESGRRNQRNALQGNQRGLRSSQRRRQARCL